MNSLRNLPFALGLPAALLLGGAAAVAGHSRQDAAAPTMAVVDIDRVLKSYPGAEAEEEGWKVMEASFQRQMEGLENEVKEAMAQREAFNQGTEERARANLIYELKRLEYEETGKILSAQAKQRKVDISLALYAELRQGIAAFAKQKGLQFVLRLRSEGVNQQKPLRLETNQQREILYHDPAADLTEDVIRFLKTWKPAEAAPAANGDGR